jgi:hypothetical protein
MRWVPCGSRQRTTMEGVQVARERENWRLFPENWVLLCLLAVLSCVGPCSNLRPLALLGKSRASR